MSIPNQRNIFFERSHRGTSDRLNVTLRITKKTRIAQRKFYHFVGTIWFAISSVVGIYSALDCAAPQDNALQLCFGDFPTGEMYSCSRHLIADSGTFSAALLWLVHFRKLRVVRTTS